MLVVKTNPVGVDKVINDIQNAIYTSLMTSNPTWDWECYPRAYRNPQRYDQRGYIPEVYTANGEYKEVFFDDHFDLTTFFVASDSRDVINGMATQDISLIIQGDLSALFSSISHRADEELNNAFWVALENYGVDLTSIETGIENVYREFARGQVILDDFGKYYVARLNMTVTFDGECCTNCN